MNTPKPLRVLGVCLVIASVLPGCATYRKCGFDGCPGDSKTTAKVQASFDQDPALGPPNSIDVQTLDHVVYLSGFVSAGLQGRTAESLARQVPGVERVVNEIAVEK